MAATGTGVGVGVGRNICLEFMTKVYAAVDDPSTDSLISWGPKGDSFIVWNPAQCCRDLFPRLLDISDFGEFVHFGFKRVESSRQLEYACDDFVKGQPELLEKISKRHQARRYEAHGKRLESLAKRVKSCKTRADETLVFREYMKNCEMKVRAQNYLAIEKDVEKVLQFAAAERERRGQPLSKLVEIHLKLVADVLHNLKQC